MKASCIILCIMMKGLTIELHYHWDKNLWQRGYLGRQDISVVYTVYLSSPKKENDLETQKKLRGWGYFLCPWPLLTELVASLCPIGWMANTIFCDQHLSSGTLSPPLPPPLWWSGSPLPPHTHILAFEKPIQTWIFTQAILGWLLGHPKGMTKVSGFNVFRVFIDWTFIFFVSSQSCILRWAAKEMF